MSFLVVGIEMPKDCDECWTKFRGFGFVEHDEEWGTFYCKAGKGFCSDPRTKCPLRPLSKEHGPLIDASIAYDKIAEQDGGNYVDMDLVGRGLDETPTIIEAEE